MKYFIFLSFFILTHSAKSQILNVQTAHKLITTAISMTDAKKLLNQTHNFISQGETSDAGNINYQFESKSSNHYTLNILYSTAFDRIAYIHGLLPIGAPGIFSDGIHPSSHGFAIMAERLEPQFRRVLLWNSRENSARA